MTIQTDNNAKIIDTNSKDRAPSKPKKVSNLAIATAAALSALVPPKSSEAQVYTQNYTSNPAAVYNHQQQVSTLREITDLTYKLFNGDIVQLSKLTENNLVLVHVWSPSCGPCVNELPELRKIVDHINKFNLVNPTNGKKLDNLIVLSISGNYSDHNYEVWQQETRTHLSGNSFINIPQYDLTKIQQNLNVTSTPYTALTWGSKERKQSGVEGGRISLHADHNGNGGLINFLHQNGFIKK